MNMVNTVACLRGNTERRVYLLGYCLTLNPAYIISRTSKSWLYLAIVHPLLRQTEPASRHHSRLVLLSPVAVLNLRKGEARRVLTRLHQLYI